MFIDSDMVLEPTVLADLAATFEARPEVGAVIIPQRSFGVGFLASCRVLEKEPTSGWTMSRLRERSAPRYFDPLGRDAVGGRGLGPRGPHPSRRRRDRAGLLLDLALTGKISLRDQFAKKRYDGRWVAEYLSRKPETRQHVSRPGLRSQLPALLASPVRTGGLVKSSNPWRLRAWWRHEQGAAGRPGQPAGQPWAGRAVRMTRIVDVFGEFSAKTAMG